MEISDEVWEIAQDLYDDADFDINRYGELESFTVMDFEDYNGYYRDCKKSDYEKAKQYLDELLSSVKYYEGKLVLSDNDTLNNIPYDDIPEEGKKYNEDNFWEIQSFVYDKALQGLQEEIGTEVYGLGRSGKHICVDDNFKNLTKLDEYKIAHEKWEQWFIDEMVKELSYTNGEITESIINSDEKVAKCLSCGMKVKYRNRDVQHDAMGDYIECPNCHATFDVDVEKVEEGKDDGIFTKQDVKSYLGDIAKVVANVVRKSAKSASVEMPDDGELMNKNSVIVYELPIKFIGDVVGLGEEIRKELLAVLESGKIKDVKCVPTTTKNGTVLTLSIIGSNIVNSSKTIEPREGSKKVEDLSQAEEIILADEINTYLMKNQLYPVDVFAADTRVMVEIEWGDWKHDHLRCDDLMKAKGYTLVEEEVTEEDGSDCYSAIRHYEPEGKFDNVDIQESKKTEAEDMTQVKSDVEKAVDETDNTQQELDQVKGSIDVLKTDEESAIEGYEDFNKETAKVVDKELADAVDNQMQEIIDDEKEHIEKLDTIKSALGESKKSGKKLDYKSDGFKGVNIIVVDKKNDINAEEYLDFDSMEFGIDEYEFEADMKDGIEEILTNLYEYTDVYFDDVFTENEIDEVAKDITQDVLQLYDDLPEEKIDRKNGIANLGESKSIELCTDGSCLAKSDDGKIFEIVYDDEEDEPYYTIECTDKDGNALEVYGFDTVYNSEKEAEDAFKSILNDKDAYNKLLKSTKTEAKFKDKVSAIKKSLKQKDGRLTDKTAEEQAERIAGSMIKNEDKRSNDIYKYKGKEFRYDCDNAIVEYIWTDPDTNECVVIDEIGLSNENWEDRKLRDAYLDEYIRQLDDEANRLADDFIANEFLGESLNQRIIRRTESKETKGDLLNEIEDALSISEINIICDKFKNEVDRKLIQSEIDAIEQEYDIDNIDEDSDEYQDILNELKSCIASNFSGEENDLNEGKELRHPELNNSIKDYYTTAFETDELKDEVKDATFLSLYRALKNKQDVYDLIGVNDSVVRERLFAELARILNQPIEYVNNIWQYGVEDGQPNIVKEDKETGTIKESLNTGVLPIVNVDMYSIWSSGMLDNYDIPDEEVGKLDEIVQDIAPKYIKEAIQEILPSVEIYATGVYHPKEYNFGGDELEFDLVVSADEYNKLKDEVLANPEFDTFLKDNFSSRSGFISKLADNVDDFEDEVQWKQLVQVIMFAIRNENSEKIDEDYLNEFIETVGQEFPYIDEEDLEEGKKEELFNTDVNVNVDAGDIASGNNLDLGGLGEIASAVGLMASEEDIKNNKEKLAEDNNTYEYALEVRNKDTKEFIRQVDCYNTPEEAEKSAKDLKLNDNEEAFISVITYDSNGEEIGVEVYEDAEELNERFLGPSDETIADSKAKGLYSESAELSYGDLEDLAKDIFDWYDVDMGTHFDEVQGNEEEIYGDIMTVLETKDQEQIQHFIDDITEADIDDDTAKEVNIATTSSLLERLKALLK